MINNPKKQLLLSYLIFLVVLLIFVMVFTVILMDQKNIIDKSSASVKSHSENTKAEKLLNEALGNNILNNLDSKLDSNLDSNLDPNKEFPQTTSSYQNEEITPLSNQSQNIEHIPYTSQPVISGQSETYKDTVGQCPFYENAGPKGCIPPADLECNSDWTICKPKE